MGIELSLKGKVALVTGGSRGIGAATVKMFTQAGARVAFNYRAAQAQAEALASACGGYAQCAAIKQELSSPADGRALVAEAVRVFGRVDVLVANHGVWPDNDAPIDKMTDEQWRTTMSVNVDAVFGLVQAAVGHMKQQAVHAGAAAGHIVLISSTAGQRGEAFHADYAASKGAVISMTKGLSTELARDRIYVNCVAPGWVATDMSAGALGDAATNKKVMGTIPLGRVATAEEIAGPVLFLCTPHAGFVTGEVFNVNGGAVLAG
jgi:3-oxoacyl-[acyl-carrier protein] reductase